MVKLVTAEELKKESGNYIVDFYADWCGPCRMLAPILEKLSEEIDTVKFFKIDVETDREFAIKNNISSIPAIILYQNGVEKKRRVGFASKDDFKKWLEEN